MGPTESDELVAIMKRVFWCWNHHDLEGVRKYVNVNDWRGEFRDCQGNLVQELLYIEFEDQMRRLMLSFPDFNLNHQDELQRLENEDGVESKAESDQVVFIPRLVMTGTHTGAPFAFGPCRPIEATRKFIQLDPEAAYHTFRKGKLIRMEVKAYSDKTGPAGIYSLLGGFPLLGKLPPALPSPP